MRTVYKRLNSAMDIREMRYILEIERARNITQASYNLYISQPALYKALQKVEAEYETVLFYKEGRELYPTDTGKIVVSRARDILSILKHMEDEIIATKELRVGETTIGFPSVVGSLYLCDVIFSFQCKYPKITVHTVEEGGETLLFLVKEGKVETAIVMGPINCDGINEIPILSDQIVACVPKRHEWANRAFVSFADFKNVPFVSFTEGFNVHKLLLNKFQEEKIHPIFAMQGRDSQFLYRYATRSGNVLILPAPMIRLNNTSDQICLLPFRPALSWDLFLVYRKDSYISTAAKVLINHVQSHFFSLDSILN